ncbi:DUF7619 domain-containing protein [Xanthocytophaga flava]|uniref:DUF7619 domain-containing protein n=1 Tax=Xanthocytophaga flava TaxID=3048013 RepID=UPI0028D5F2E9|nr:6-bladed beta-propeller [Xanthocytophaga flavus]MDJ1473393.1 6-bladed beta-propeller [Xanthocytophaga flavus]
MMKSLLSVLLFILTTLIFGISGWGQQYTLKRTIGKTNVYDPIDLSVDKQGFVYVSSAPGSVVKMDPDGVYQSTFAYALRPNDLSVERSTALDEAGNIWMADSYNNQIVKFDPKGNILLKFGSVGSRDGQFNYPTGIALDSQENIWIADQSNHRVQKFDKNGKFLLKVGSRGSGNGQFSFPKAVTTDSEGNVWIVETGNHRIQKFDKNGSFLLKVGSLGDANGQFNYPCGLETDSDDNVWVVELFNNRLQKFDKNGVFLTSFGTFGSDEGQLNGPQGLTIDHQGIIWVACPSNYRIQRFDASGKFMGTYGSPGSNNDQFNNPQDIAVDNQGNTWVADSSNHRVQKFDAEGNYLLTIGVSGSVDTQLLSPCSVATDPQGNVWVTDIRNACVKKFDTNGKFLLKFGSKGNGNGQFGSPSGIALDSQENIWVVDQSNHRVQKFDKNGKFLLQFGSLGLGQNQFLFPSSIATDSQGVIWVADSGNSRILKFDSNGKFLLEIKSQGFGDGQFWYGGGIDIDSEDNLWLADDRNYRIQKFDSNGKFLLKIDNLINSPNWLTLDKNGDIFWTDEGRGVFVYSTDQKSFISGKVYADKNQNCSFDNTDVGIPNVMVVANPGGYYSNTDKFGNYRIAVPVGTFTISQVLNTDTLLLQSVCPANNISAPITLVKEKEQVTGITFANKVTAIPHLEVFISSTRRRRCFTNETTVTCTNSGYASARNVKVYLRMPEFVLLKYANKPYTIDKDSNYVFTIDSLGGNQSDTIHIIDSVACLAEISGWTQCTKAWITPANTYTLPANSTWDNSDIVLTGKCIENGRVQMVIKNMGQAMADSAEFRVMLNAQLAFRKNYKLAAGDSLVLKVPANGKTVRLEADQRPGHPRKSQTNLTIEGCVASSSDIVSKGFVDVLPQDDAEPEVAIQCMQIVDSFDPNDKLVSPAGTPVDHYTPTNSELKYTIRFQNTGTDYAYKVVVVDTLSDKLDITTLKMGAASHGYSLKVSGKGQPVLTWTFNNINLPDSTHDQAGSNGFIQFSIKPKANLPEKTLIENYADIFFDYNDPVRTNTTMNVMYDVPKVINPANQLDESIIDDKVMAAEPDALKGKLSLYPNPTQSQVWIQSVDLSVRIEQVKIYNLLGESQTVSLSSADNQTVQINMQAKPKGMYLVHIQTNKGTSIQRVVVQ